MFDFKSFSNKLEEKKVDIVEDRTTETYTYLCLWNLSSLEHIDLDKLTVESIIDAKRDLEESITYEDTDGMLFLDPNSPGFQVNALGYKLNAMERVERIRPTSPYRFI